MMVWVKNSKVCLTHSNVHHVSGAVQVSVDTPS